MIECCNEGEMCLAQVRSEKIREAEQHGYLT
jgi:hypothetical protein